jgi:outer membrane protein OmpA-like peptidoglycan-associated protein
MRKNAFWGGLLAICALVANVYAEDSTDGFVMSVYGHALKGAYGDCVHTAYYDPQHNKRVECGDVEPPVEVPQTVVETVTMSDAGDVLFNFDAATLTPIGVSKITGFGKKLGKQADIASITIDGYTDAIGSSQYNLNLSANRSAAVKQFFVKNGVPAAIITTHGYGEKDTKVSTACMKKYSLKNRRRDLIACTAPDRRVVFTIVHHKKVEKTVMVKQTASAPEPDVSNLPQPPAGGQ